MNKNQNTFITALDTITRAIPQSKQAAVTARNTAESLQHHFGPPTYFLTVTPDDETSLLIQIYSKTIVDKNFNFDKITDKELAQRSKQQNELRIKYPGICALVYEELMKIIIEKVIGWDLKKK